jgi:hypothetical protein
LYTLINAANISAIEDMDSAEDLEGQTKRSAEVVSPTEMLEREAIIRRKEEWAGAAWSMLFLVSMLSIAKLNTSSIAALQRDMAICFALLGVVGAGVYTQLFRSASRRKRVYMKALSNGQDVKQISALIHTSRGTSAPVRNLAKRALIDLLPQLRASDADKLSESERGILLRHLAINPRDLGHREVTEMFSPSAFRREVDLRVSILKAYEQVGGVKELAAVSKLARGIPTLQQSPPLGEIKRAANACLPYLEQRANDERASRHLLRASGPEAMGNGELLRPVLSVSATGDEELLRAVEAPGVG